MQFYELDTLLDFGKYQGMTLGQVLDMKPEYINWCVKHVLRFCLTDDTLGNIRARVPGFELSKEEELVLYEKLQTWASELLMEEHRKNDFREES